MPQFYAEHVPAKTADSFIRGYFEAAEWLLPTDTGEPEYDMNRDKIRGWSRAARRTMIADCRDFMRANKTDLALYCDLSGRDMDSAGTDFFLSREDHGAGFFDRGNDPVFNRLQRAARMYGECGIPYLSRGWINI